MIDLDVLREINYIIEFDVTSSTYKYALLKAVINATQKYEHLITKEHSRASIPLGLIIEEWICDYMPFVFANVKQQHSGAILDRDIELHYHNIFNMLGIESASNWEYAYKEFMQAYRYQLISNKELSHEFLKLAKKIACKIVTMPMKYTGKEHYAIFQPHTTTFGDIKINPKQTYDAGFIDHSFDMFDISLEHYYIFRYLGQSLYGTSTIQAKWKSKTIALNKSTSQASEIEKMLGEAFDGRDTTTARTIFTGEQECVWSGRPLSQNNMDIDHMLPYSVWMNNDLWNLLPAQRDLNQHKKREKIPTRTLIKKRSEIIKHYWNIYDTKLPQLFHSQLSISLTGDMLYMNNNYDVAIESLCAKSDYLIHDRGLVGFEM